jgi:hypothetical protein
MKRLLFASTLAITSPAAATQTVTLTVDAIDVGRLKLGQVVDKLPSGVRKRKDCRDRKDPLSCSVLLNDGIWYVFVDRRVADKTIELPSKFVPPWIDPAASPAGAKRQLERLLRRKFRTWMDDYGTVYLETDDSLKSPYGMYFNILIRFNKGRMRDVSITSLPHPDV